MMKTFDLLSATINSLILSVILIILIEMIGVFLNISLFLSTSLSSSYTTIYPFSNPAIKVIVLLFIFCFTSKHSTGDSNFLEFSRFNIYFCSLNPYFLIFPNDDPVYMISFSFLFFWWWYRNRFISSFAIVLNFSWNPFKLLWPTIST